MLGSFPFVFFISLIRGEVNIVKFPVDENISLAAQVGDPTGWNYHPPIVSSYVGQLLFELLANELPRIVSSQQVQYYPSINSTAQRRGRQEAERSANHTERPEHELDQTGQKS